MSLVKWMRKNNKKVMAVVVIVLMFAFIGGSALEYLLQGSGGAGQAVAYYGQTKKTKITRYQFSEAMQELEVLQFLHMDVVMQQAFDMRGLLLGELIFSQNRGSAESMNRAMQIIQQYRLPVSDKQLSEIYERTASPAFYWLLLRNEAESAGIRTPPAQAGLRLANWLPQLFPDQTRTPDEIYRSVMSSVVNRFRVSDQTVIEIVGRMLAVLEYASTVCSTQEMTIPELTHMASWAIDSLSVDAVQLEARVFADKQSKPTDEALLSQFDKYKGRFRGHVTDDNPFGFGYRLRDRVQLDYVALRLSDVERIVPAPTDDDAIEYHRQNRDTIFTRQVPSDPNDPNSPPVLQTIKLTDVKDRIIEQLKQDRINTRAEQILDEVRSQADANLQVGASEGKGLSLEEAKARAGDYGKIAQEVADRITKELADQITNAAKARITKEDPNKSKEEIDAAVAKQVEAAGKFTLYSGQTGWLSAMDIESDKRLGGLYVGGQGKTNAPLTQVLFSVEAFGPDAAVLLFTAKPRMYMTIGPARSPARMMNTEQSDRIMMIARIVGAGRAAEPENLDVSYSTKAIDLGEPAAEQKNQTHSVRQEVIEDLQMQAAWDTTKAKADEFLALASKEGWEPAIAKFNDLYGKQAKEDPNDPNVFVMAPMTSLRRISNAEIQATAARVVGSPVGPTGVYRVEVDKRRNDLFFALVPPDAASAPNMPQVIEFKPDQSFYAVKSISARWLSQQQYDSLKGSLLQWADGAQVQSLAVTHLNPANILKRMNFRYAKVEEPTTETEAGATEPNAKGAK